MTNEGLGEMLEGDFADMYGGRACADTGGTLRCFVYYLLALNILFEVHFWGHIVVLKIYQFKM